MKKIAITLGILISLLLLGIILTPLLFKDEIKAALDQTLDDNLEATVYYDTDALSLSLLKNFPDITLALGDFGLVGKGVFTEDTLLSVQNFEVTLDLGSLLSGDQIEIKEIFLGNPKVNVLVTENGIANYDITHPSDTTQESVPSTESDSEVNISINRWTIQEGAITYTDHPGNLSTQLIGLNHSGSGDFTLDKFDLKTTTSISSFSLMYDDIAYVSNKRIEADLTLGMDLESLLFSFKENRIAINQFEMGIDGEVQMKDEDILMNLRFGGKQIDLKSILSLIPGMYQSQLSGLNAGGTLAFDGQVKGTYNEDEMPQVAARLSVADGSIQHPEVAAAIDKINIETSFDVPSADLTAARFDIATFSMEVEGEPISGRLALQDFEDFKWDFALEGRTDLGKMTAIFPIENTEIKGLVNLSFKSKGNKTLVDNEQYEDLFASGSLAASDFYFASPEFAYGLGLQNAALQFDPSSLSLTAFDGYAGDSDFSMTGQIENYLAYVLSEQALLKGSLSLQSKKLNVNELIPEYETEEAETDTAATEAVKVPENIHFTFASSIDEILYSDLTLKNFRGGILVKDGAITLQENTFNLLDGTFAITGSYITKDLDTPRYDLGFEVKDLSIANAFHSFSTIQKYVPIARQVTGTFSTSFSVDGLLGSDMMPLMEAINLDGLINVAQASLSSGSFMSQLNSLTALNSADNSSGSEKTVSLKDVLIQAAIKEGRLFIQPFNLEVMGQKATLGGSNSLDGALDYSLLVKDISTGAAGAILSSAVQRLTGQSDLIAGALDIDIGIGGSYDDISLQLLGASPSGTKGGTSAQEVFKQQMASKVDEQKAKAEAEIAEKKAAAEAKAKAALDAQKAALEAKKKAAQDSIKAAEAAAKKKLEEEAKKKVKNLFKRGGGD